MTSRRLMLSIFTLGFITGASYLISCGKDNTSKADTGSSRVVKGNGETIGEFVSVAINRQPTLNNFIVRTSTGFLLPVLRNGSVDIDSLHYSSNDCSGTAYTDYGAAKVVFRNGSSLYYIPLDTTEGSGTSQSYRNNTSGDCAANSSDLNEMITALPNDPSVTGVSSLSFTTPITIE